MKLQRSKGKLRASQVHSGQESACQCRKQKSHSIPGSGRSPGGGNDNPLQYSCLASSMDREARQAAEYGVAKSWTKPGPEQRKTPNQLLTVTSSESPHLPTPISPDFLLCFRSRLPSLPRMPVTVNITHQSSGALNLLRPSEQRKLPPLISSVTLVFQEMSSLPQHHPQGRQLQVLLIEQLSSEMSFFFFFLLSHQHLGSQVPDQGSNTCPLH